MKIVFLGTPEFAKIVLQKLINSHHKVVGVVTTLDKESGRGQKIVFSPVKQFALENKIPLFQFKNISNQGFDLIKALNPDLLITASFGQILRQNILDLAPLGVLNVHPSLLPKYRGSCPVHWSIIKGEKITGVSIMKTDIGMDTGDVILVRELEILPDETAGELTFRLAHLGADALLEALDQIKKGNVKFQKQNDSKSSYYPMLNKDIGKIDFSKTASDIQNLCNGLNPWPLCFFEFNGQRIKVLKARPFDFHLNSDKKHGEVVFADCKNGLVVKCGDGLVLLDIIKAPNGRAMKSTSFLNGNKINIGQIF